MARICDMIMECFTSGYQALTDLESKENLSYDEIKDDLDQMSSEWENLHKEETLPKIEETLKYFSRFTDNEPEKSEVDNITKRAEKFRREFQALSTRHTEMAARAGVDSKLVEERYEYSKKMKSQIVLHGKNALIAAVLLGMILGGLIAWSMWNGQILPVVFGVLIGGGAVLVLGGVTYFIFAAVAARGVNKWEDLHKRASEFQKMDKIIDRKAQELYAVPRLLNMIANKVQTVKQGSIQLVKQCEGYIGATTT